MSCYFVATSSISPMRLPDVCASVFDMLFNFDDITMYLKPTALEIAVLVVDVLRQAKAASQVCRSWSSALSAVCNPCVIQRLLQIERCAPGLNVPSLRDALAVFLAAGESYCLLHVLDH